MNLRRYFCQLVSALGVAMLTELGQEETKP